jgi:hypothetical protein
MTMLDYPKNLAQLKKHLQPGVTVYMVYRSLDGDQSPPRALTVHTADTVKVGWGGNSYHTFWKAKHYTFTAEGFTLSDYNGENAWTPVSRYTWADPQPKPAPTAGRVLQLLLF